MGTAGDQTELVQKKQDGSGRAAARPLFDYMNALQRILAAPA